MRNRFAYLSALLLIFLLTTGCSHMRAGDLALVTPASNQPRAGNVYLLRGWIGIFSAGIDDLTGKINASGVRAHVYQDDQWRSLGQTIKDKYAGVRNPEPLVLIGHSYGADDVIRVARDVGESGVKVDLLITLDPVTPPEIPSNVVVCQNYYRPGTLDIIPVLRGVPVTKVENSTGEVDNLNMKGDRIDLLEPGSSHFNIEKNQKIHAEVISSILAKCPERHSWSFNHAPARAALPPPVINASTR